MMSDALILLEEVKARYKINKKLTKTDRTQVEKELLRLLEEPATFKDGLRLMLSFPVEISCSSCMQYVGNLDPQQRSGFAKDLIQSKIFDKKQDYNYLLPLIKGCIDLPDQIAIILLEHLLHVVSSADSKKYSEKFLKKFREELLVSKALLKLTLADTGLTSSKVDLLAILTLHSLLDESGDQAELIGRHIIWFGSANKKMKLPADISIRLENYANKLPPDIQQLLENSGMVCKAKDSSLGSVENQMAATNQVAFDTDLQRGRVLESARLQQARANNIGTSDYKTHLEALDEYINHQNFVAGEAKKRITELESRHARTVRDFESAEQNNRNLNAVLKQRDEEKESLSVEIAQLKTQLDEQKIYFEKVVEGKNIEAEKLLEQLKSEIGFAKNELLNILTRSLSFHYDEFSSIEKKEMTPELGDHLMHITKKVFSELKKNGCFDNRG